MLTAILELRGETPAAIQKESRGLVSDACIRKVKDGDGYIARVRLDPASEALSILSHVISPPPMYSLKAIPITKDETLCPGENQ